MRVLVTGGTGMVGSAFKDSSRHQFIKVSSREFNLTNFTDSLNMLSKYRPDSVIHLAAKVGGVKGNTEFVGDFFRENILINTNVLEACRWYKIPKVVSLLSTCIYPDNATYPLTEDQIHSGEPHTSNFGYAYAKRMLHVQSMAYRKQYGCNFVCAVPNNLFGKNDNFDLENGHVIPSVIRKVHEAKVNGEKSVTFWGDGSALREFTYNEDIADSLIFLMENYDGEAPVNIGNTNEISIRDLVDEIVGIFDYTGDVIWDTSKPSGQHRKPSDNSFLKSLGHNIKHTDIRDALADTCAWFSKNYPRVRGLNY